MTILPDEPLIDVKDLSVVIDRDEGVVRPLNGVSFRIAAGQAVGIVGESGCGKTMTSNALLRILPPAAEITSGHMRYRRKSDEQVVDLATIDADSDEMRQIRGSDISMIFQEPMTAFSPVHTVHNQIAEMIQLHSDMDDEAARKRVVEPTTALDVTVQARVLKLIQRLQQELGLALMLITHDLGVIAHAVEYVYVMYLGQVVEEGPVAEIFDHPAHPYTQALLHSIPSLTSKAERLEPIDGSVPSAYALPSGCPFHTRCTQKVGDICHQQMPGHAEVGPGHRASCFIHEGADG